MSVQRSAWLRRSATAASVVCAGDSDNFEIGTVSESGYRVLISSSSTGTPSRQIVDPDFVVRFPSGARAAALRPPSR